MKTFAEIHVAVSQYRHIGSQLTMASIMYYVSQVTGIETKEIKGVNRKGDIIMARHVFMYLCRYHLKGRVSLKDIGSYCGGKDHSTVVHAFNSIQGSLDVRDERGIVAKQIIDGFYNLINN